LIILLTEALSSLTQNSQSDLLNSNREEKTMSRLQVINTLSQIKIIPFDGQEIGQGYNSETHENIGTALIVANISEDPVADGQEVTTIFESVTSQESLIESLGCSLRLIFRWRKVRLRTKPCREFIFVVYCWPMCR
jgi:hypothetical protein